MWFSSSMSEMARLLMVKEAEPEAERPPSTIRRLLMVSKVVEAPCDTAGQKPRVMLAKTTSVMVLVAFKNSIADQFSKEVRLASTWPCQKRSRGLSGQTVLGVLCRIMES